MGEFARLKTRKARHGDCICSNESAYYPPLTKLKGFVPGVTIEGDVGAEVWELVGRFPIAVPLIWVLSKLIWPTSNSPRLSSASTSVSP